MVALNASRKHKWPLTRTLIPKPLAHDVFSPGEERCVKKEKMFASIQRTRKVFDPYSD